MVTDYGKFLRKLRIDNGEILKTMAQKLDVSSAFLSAVENGKKKIPRDWDEKINSIYLLENDDFEKLLQARHLTESRIEIELESLTENQRETVFAFSRSIERFNTQDLTTLMAFFNKESEDLDAE